MLFPNLPFLVFVFAIPCLFASPSPQDASAQVCTLTLHVYSGTEDPQVDIAFPVLVPILHALPASDLDALDKFKTVKGRIGYRGFSIVCAHANPTLKMHVFASSTAEQALLKAFVAVLPEPVLSFVGGQIGEMEALHDKLEIHYKAFPSLQESCQSTPIWPANPTGYPTYAPDSDDGGCFETEQSNNNCYNYGTDVVTNSFAKPGRGSGQMFSDNTCDDVKAAAVRDGLQWIGPYNSTLNHRQVALFIWPDYNFHWARQDNDGYWSHKPGGTEVRREDSKGNQFKDPHDADMSPWSIYCGTFSVTSDAADLQIQ